MQTNIRRLAYLLLSCFILLSFYLGYINVLQGPALAADPHNRRLAAYEAKIVRGVIYDREGVPLAENKRENNTLRRIYPQGADAAQVVGFVSPRYGRTGLESAYDRYLLGMTDEDKVKALLDRLLGRQQAGDNVVVTLDARLQHLAMQLLAGRKGAVAALDPRTGDILALASSPSFDPNNIDQVTGEKNGKPVTVYDQLQSNSAAPLLDRAAQGAYPPGSVFKLVTGSGALAANPAVAQKVIDCRGGLTVNGFYLKDNAVHGVVNFRQALTVSCNTYFATLGLDLGKEKFYQTAVDFGLTKNPWDSGPGSIPEIAYRPGSLTPAAQMSRPQLASSAIGQGHVLVNPLQMALIAAAIANRGVIMRPHLLAEVRAPGGAVMLRDKPQPWLTATTPEAAREMTADMVAVVNSGTGRAAAIPGVTVAGKTGTAENPAGAPHAWFTGFAPAGSPRVAVAVVLENAGYGGEAAAPVAREIMRAALTVPGI
ncbi:peptidoglycan D,D-transpeptidase FtsI family protein [Desulfotomaculum copahuensis]|uniref:Cell division protein FtsI n=1 Tax=Desulfotomaculum copahuensis TaxID=1838280 RepID=A0A1B7LE81_9FIRM|nr:penicillin-binding transpeptidase domain-containing protein [Desulfotomaculum copahuensis]OAT81412.1 cell division protein FtsI [Desulfotomaculum copahuensis]